MSMWSKLSTVMRRLLARLLGFMSGAHPFCVFLFGFMVGSIAGNDGPFSSSLRLLGEGAPEKAIAARASFPAPENLPNAIGNGIHDGRHLRRDSDGEQTLDRTERGKDNGETFRQFVGHGVNTPDFTWGPLPALENNADPSVNDRFCRNLSRNFGGDLNNNRHRPFRGEFAAPLGPVAPDHSLR